MFWNGVFTLQVRQEDQVEWRAKYKKAKTASLIDPYGLITSGTERVDLKHFDNVEERKQHATDILIKMSTRWSETRGYKILGITLGIPPEKYERYIEKYGKEDNPSYVAAVKYWASDLDATAFVVKLDHDGNLRDAAANANKIWWVYLVFHPLNR